MKLNRNQSLALGTGLQVGGTVLKALDANNTGTDDRAGQAFTTAGMTMTQLASGESPTKKGKAADALDAVGDALKALAAELRAE